MAHTHHDPSYWTRRHPESVLLDIGDDVGALILYTPANLHGAEIEVSPLGLESQAARTHSAVLERSIKGRTVYAAVYPELAAGEYEVLCEGKPTVRIVGGRVSEVTSP